jgi:16S rRNA (guanine966-N2)-methyltransferase
MAAGAGGPFDLAFLDAPYRKGLTAPALASLRDGGWLRRGALLIAETAEDETLEAPGFTSLDRRVYGETAVHIFAVS